MFHSLTMDRRLIFPTTMFVIAGASFAYGIWQHVVTQRVQASADARLAFVMSAVEGSRVSRQEKQDLYSVVFNGLPSAPSVWGIDLSGSFAAPAGSDRCISDGQRAVCSALRTTAADASTLTRICGVCEPK